MKNIILSIALIALASCGKEPMPDDCTMKLPISFTSSARDANGIMWNLVSLEVTIDCDNDIMNHCGGDLERKYNTPNTRWILMDSFGELVDTIQFEERWGLKCD